MKCAVLILLLTLSMTCAINFDGGVGCMKVCGSWFSNCYKMCYVPSFEDAVTQMKRDNDCLNGCILKLSTCHHYCSSR